MDFSFDGFSFDGFGSIPKKTKQESSFSAWDNGEPDIDIRPGLKNIGVMFPKFKMKS